MIYKHEIDECIKRAREQQRVARRYHNPEFIDHIQRRIDSLERLRKKAPTAIFGVKVE